MKCACLLSDTYDACKMGDVDRILCNAKFQMFRLCNHTKYQLWLFGFIAYISLLLPQKGSECKWNCCTNLHGGTAITFPMTIWLNF